MYCYQGPPFRSRDFVVSDDLTRTGERCWLGRLRFWDPISEQLCSCPWPETENVCGSVLQVSGCQKGAPASCVLKSTLAWKPYGKVCLKPNSKHSCLPVNSYGIGFLEMGGVYYLTSVLEGETLGCGKSLRKGTYLTLYFGPNPTPFPGDIGKKIPALPLTETSSQKTELLWTWVEIWHSNLFRAREMS